MLKNSATAFPWASRIRSFFAGIRTTRIKHCSSSGSGDSTAPAAAPVVMSGSVTSSHTSVTLTSAPAVRYSNVSVSRCPTTPWVFGYNWSPERKRSANWKRWIRRLTRMV